MPKSLKILILVAFALFAGATPVLGQNIFQKRSDVNIAYVRYNSVFTSDTGFFVTGWDLPLITVDSNTVQLGNYQLLYSWYNWDGQLLNHKVFGESFKNFNANWFDTDPQSENAIFNFGTLSDTSDPYDIMAIKFNRNCDTIWTRRYNSGNEDYGYSCISDNYGGMIGVGTSKIGSSYCSRVIRYDSLGGVVWNKTFNCGSANFTGYIIKDNNENYYIGGARNGNNAPNNGRTMVFKIDSAGTLIWTKYLPAICSESAGALSFADDGNILVANGDCINEISFTTYSRFGLTKLNRNTGDTLWSKTYSTQYKNSTNTPLFVEGLNNGDIILGGMGYKLFIEDNDTFVREAGVLVKTDSLGNLKWQKYYFYNTEHADSMFENYITSGKQAPDGGLILVGKTKHFIDFDDGWIIKTDENGCIDAGCINGIEELEEDDYRLFIYPNPVQDYVSIDLPVTHNKATLQIINMQGQLVKSIAINNGGLQRIETTDLANGIYQLLITTPTKLLGKEKLVVGR